MSPVNVCAPLPSKVTVPEEFVNVPPMTDQFPATVAVPDGMVKVPEVIDIFPFALIVPFVAVSVPPSMVKVPVVVRVLESVEMSSVPAVTSKVPFTVIFASG